MRIYDFLLVLFLFFSIVPLSGAEDATLTVDQELTIKKAVQEEVAKSSAKIADDAVEKQAEAQAQRQFAGINFGVGLSLTVDTGSHDRVKDAEIVDGIVRVTTDENVKARVMLETHYFFTPDNFLWIRTNRKIENKNKVADKKTFGVGPFIALQPGTDEIIEAIGMGVMFGFKREASETTTGSWNFGVGMVVDPNVQVLGDGFEENKPPPGSETQVRFKETDQWGVLLISSFTW